MPSAPITFDFTGTSPNANSMTFLQDGLSLTVSSALYDGTWIDTGLGSGIPYEIGEQILSMTADGIGALNPYGDLETCFDADGKIEMATFLFGQTVQIVSVNLIPIGNRYNTDAVNISFVMFGDGLIRDSASRQIIDPIDHINEVSVTGTYLGLGAVYYIDGFRIAGITVVVLGGPTLTTGQDSFALNSNDAPTTLNVLANDTNVQLISGVNTTGLLGSVTLAADGQTLAYSAGSAFDYLAKGAQATETFTYTALGIDGTSQTQSVTVTVTGNPNEINGTAGVDSLTGTAGRDIIQGLADNDTLYGAAGNDDVFGGIGLDRVFGGDGNDRVDGGDGDDYVFGDAGNDTVIGGAGSDRLNGGDGNDSLDGTVGTDRLYGDAGDDKLFGSRDANIMDGGIGTDTMTGGGGSDSYYVDNSGDKIVELSSEGTDVVRATASYTLADNVENIILFGVDAIDGTGNALANRLTGNDGDNNLFGLGANDRLEGGLGNDHLVGGAGRDILTGGAGADDFVFAEWGTANNDTITDFNGAVDEIQLSGAAFGLNVGALAASQFGFGTKAITATQRFVYDQAHGDLYYDADGSGSGARQLVASLVDGTVLTYADLFVF